MSNFLTISIDSRAVRRGLKKLSTELRGKKIVSAMRTAFEGTTFRRARDLLKEHDSIFQGHLFRSLGLRVLQSGARNKVQVGTIGVRYGWNIEHGTPPGLPMDAAEFAKLTEWVRRKMLVTSYTAVSKKTGKPYTRREYVTPLTAAWVASKVAAKIKAQGILPQPFLQPAWEQTKPAFFRLFGQKLAQALGLKR